MNAREILENEGDLLYYAPEAPETRRRFRMAYRAIAEADAKLIARTLWERFVAAPDEDRDELRQLAVLNQHVPGVLGDIYADLIAHEMWSPATLYLGAPARVSEALCGKFQTHSLARSTINHLLCALAWIGDEVVERQFLAWRAEPPSWAAQLFLYPWEYATVAGWELTANGTRRTLYFDMAIELLPTSSGEQAAHVASRACIPVDERCRWCGRLLFCLLDLDLTDPRLAFSQLAGAELQVVMCNNCSCYQAIFMDIDVHGHAHWSAENALSIPEWQLHRDDLDVSLFKGGKGMILGEERRTAFETVENRIAPLFSQLGGHPEWIQDAAYIRCPRCQRRMRVLGQIATDEVIDMGEGITVALICTDCLITTTNYQQT